MKKFRTTSYLTVRLKRIHEIEAENAEEAERLFHEEGERGTLISEESVKLIGDEELDEVEDALLDDDAFDALVDDASHAVNNLIPDAVLERLTADQRSDLLISINDVLTPILREAVEGQL